MILLSLKMLCIIFTISFILYDLKQEQYTSNYNDLHFYFLLYFSYLNTANFAVVFYSIAKLSSVLKC
jgi:hypothetical protein